MDLRTALNQAGPNEIASLLQQLMLGEALALALEEAADTDSVAVTANVATLNGTPSAIPFQINGSAGTHTGIKKVLRGPIAGEGKILPAAGEVVWDGANKLLFAASDAISHAIVTYAIATRDDVSFLLRSLTDPQLEDNMNIRDDLNTADQNRLSPLFSQEQGGIALGEVLALLLTNAYAENPTESGVTVTDDACQLADQPVQLFIVDATGGTEQGVKKLLIGRVSGDGAISPGAGEVVWDGGINLLFNADDAVTACGVLYSTAAGQQVSVLLRSLGEADAK